MASETVLCLNAGSSSLKFALFAVTESGEHALASGAVTGLGTAEAHATLSIGEQVSKRAEVENPDAALRVALDLLQEHGLPQPTLVGHRVVHGGPNHVHHVLVDGALLTELGALVPLAPLHLPGALRGIELASEQFPNVPQVACFDTAFHAAMPELTRRFSLPAALYDAGVRHYGFHGLSYEYIVSTLSSPVPARIIIAHLGSGASLAAVANGVCVDPTMGFTPGSGIMMGTRIGDIDPGILLYLLREKGHSAESLERLLDRESGLLGVGGSSDLQALTQRAAHDEQARLALEMFSYSVRKAIGAYIAALGGLDLRVFTGGIGENSALIRDRACHGLRALGVELDAERNAARNGEIQRAGSACVIRVIATDEDRMVARHARAVAAAHASHANR